MEDLRSQVESLEGIRVKLKLKIEELTREKKTEAQRAEEELDSLQSCFKKKIKMLEYHLNEEIDRKMTLIRGKQELERQLVGLEAAQNELHEKNTQLKLSLRRTKALLKDSQIVVEQGTKNGDDSKEMLQKLSTELAKERDQVAQINRTKQKVKILILSSKFS